MKYLTFLLLFIFIISCKTVKETTMVELAAPVEKVIEAPMYEESASIVYEEKALANIVDGEFGFEISPGMGMEMEEDLVGSPANEIIVEEFSIIEEELGVLSYSIDTIFIKDVVTKVEASIRKFGTTPSDTIFNTVEVTYRNTDGYIIRTVIPIGEIMNVDLVPLDEDAFIINKISSDDQAINESVTKWIWGVKAVKLGEFNLILKVTIKDNGMNKERIVFDKKIFVNNKPKVGYSYELIVPTELMKYEENFIYLNVKEGNDTMFIWGGSGIIELNVEEEENFEIKYFGDYKIDDSKKHFEYKWSLKPSGRVKELNYNMKIDNNTTEEKIIEGTAEINNNYKYQFYNIFYMIIQKWYFLLSSIIIPFGVWIRKRYKKKKENKKRDD